MANPIITFKSNLPSLTVLKINTTDIETLKATIRKKIRQAPMMFIGMQVVIDVSDLDKSDLESMDFSALKDCLMGDSIHPVAIMSNYSEIHQLSINSGMGALPVLIKTNTPTDISRNKVPEQPKPFTSESYSSGKDSKAQLSEEPKKTFETQQPQTQKQDSKEAKTSTSETIRHSIRSGQSVYSHGDLTIIGSVSPGAEVIADGNIHIYGTLRGRAIAGAQGDVSANIFCQQLDAELVAIAGNYKQIDDIDNSYHGKTVQISLESEKICFFAL